MGDLRSLWPSSSSWRTSRLERAAFSGTTPHQPKDVDEKPLQELHDAIAKLDKLPVKEETVEFQIQFLVAPKTKTPDQSKRSANR